MNAADEKKEGGRAAPLSHARTKIHLDGGEKRGGGVFELLTWRQEHGHPEEVSRGPDHVERKDGGLLLSSLVAVKPPVDGRVVCPPPSSPLTSCSQSQRVKC